MHLSASVHNACVRDHVTTFDVLRAGVLWCPHNCNKTETNWSKTAKTIRCRFWRFFFVLVFYFKCSTDKIKHCLFHFSSVMRGPYSEHHLCAVIRYIVTTKQKEKGKGEARNQRCLQYMGWQGRHFVCNSKRRHVGGIHCSQCSVVILYVCLPVVMCGSMQQWKCI